MGTSNFHSNRTSCIFAIDDSYYDEELEQTIYDEFIWRDTRSNICSELRAINNDKSNTWEFSETLTISLKEELSSYPATPIGWFYSNFSFATVNITINFIPKTVSGYYSGFNLDFELQFEDEYSYDPYVYDPGSESGMVEDIINEHLYQNPQLSGIIKIHGKNILSKLQEKITEGQKLLENVFKMYSSGYKISAQFSNGETWYEKCKSA